MLKNLKRARQMVMKPDSNKRSVAGRIGLWLLLLFMVPFLYLLSIGPAVRLLRARVLPEPCLVVWEPIRPLCNYKKPLGRMLLRYQAWWLGHEYREPPKPEHRSLSTAD